MLRDQFSYWLRIEPSYGDKAKPGELEGILATLSACGAAGPDCPLTAHIEDGGISAAVPDDMGTIEESSSIRESVERAAEAWPDFKFVLDETGETDKSRQLHLEWIEGDLLIERRARLVPADASYDETTVNDLLDYLAGDKLNATGRASIMQGFKDYMERKERKFYA